MAAGIRIALTLCGLLLPLAARATPSLQVLIDPRLPENQGAFYDPVQEGWTSFGNNPVIVSVLMHDLDPTDAFKLVISTPGFDPTGIISVPVIDGSSTGAWTLGDPGLPNEGFPAYYVLHAFSFLDSAEPIFNVEDSSFDPDVLAGVVANGYRRDFQLSFPSSPVTYAIDVFDMDQPNGGSGNFLSAPNSKDARINPVPEPSAPIAFAIGGLIVAAELRRLRRTTG